MNDIFIKKNLVVTLSFKMALSTIEYTELLRRSGKYEMAGQLFRSGTSVGANIREAQNSESKQDFIHKMKIAAKEADETQYWFELCHQSAGYPDCAKQIEQLLSVQKVLNKIISTSKNNLK